MSRGAPKAKAKVLRKENEINAARRKKILIASICILVVITVAISAVFIGVWRNKSGASQNAEIYSYGGQTIQLLADGTFSANLAHNTRNGTYTKTVDGDRTMVSFDVGGSVIIGRIENNALHIPIEWDDGHGHGSVLPRVE